MPLADKLRPIRFSEVLGNKGVKNILTVERAPHSTCFWGVPGVGKTTLARLYADKINRETYNVNGNSLDAQTVKALQRKCLEVALTVIVDEFHKLDKRRQQVFNEQMETGSIIVIATTTEDPNSFLYDAVKSRMRLFRIMRPTNEEMFEHACTILGGLGIKYDVRVIRRIAESCTDVRDLIETVELLIDGSEDNTITEVVYETVIGKRLGNWTVESLKSALQKSIRGSDPDAACIYVNSLIEMGELEAAVRRLRVIVCEDIGLANPQAVSIVHSCLESALKLGIPECKYPMFQAVLFMALQPKSSSISSAIEKTMSLGYEYKIPSHIAYAHAKEYKWPHAYPDHWVSQQYVPVKFSGEQIYIPGENKTEHQYKDYWDKIKGGKIN